MMGHTAAAASALRAHEELFAYWASRRRANALPGRCDIDPNGFKRHLPTVSLTDVRREPMEFRVRLAGTGLYGLYGREITGLDLHEVYPEDEAVEWRDRLTSVVARGRPAAGVHSLAWRGNGRLSILWLRLPLATNGSEVDMILGYDAVVGLRDEAMTGIRAA
jgi:hypothetical protein